MYCISIRSFKEKEKRKGYHFWLKEENISPDLHLAEIKEEKKKVFATFFSPGRGGGVN